MATFPYEFPVSAVKPDPYKLFSVLFSKFRQNQSVIFSAIGCAKQKLFKFKSYAKLLLCENSD